MKLYLRHVEPLGFKGAPYYRTQWQSTYHQFLPDAGIMLGISQLIPNGVWKVMLTPQQVKAYLDDKVCITPPQSCAPTAGKRRVISFEAHGAWLHEGEIKSMKQLRKILSTTGLAAFKEHK